MTAPPAVHFKGKGWPGKDLAAKQALQKRTIKPEYR